MNRLQPSGPAQRQTDGRTEEGKRGRGERREEGVDQCKEGFRARERAAIFGNLPFLLPQGPKVVHICSSLYVKSLQNVHKHGLFISLSFSSHE